MSKDTVMNECCPACGCTAEIGTVITGDDTVYSTVITGTADEVKSKTEKYVALAKDADPNVKVEVVDQGDSTKIEFTFSCTAEKMIFQMRSGLV